MVSTARVQGRMLGGMDHDSASLLPDAEGSAVFASEHAPRQPNSRDAADTLTQFAFRLQGFHTLSTCSLHSTTLRSLCVTTAACACARIRGPSCPHFTAVRGRMQERAERA
jgi:hypothetical protein